MLLAAGVIIVYGFLLASQQRQLDKLNEQMCAWIVYEDGSVEERTDDFDRFKCREKY